MRKENVDSILSNRQIEREIQRTTVKGQRLSVLISAISVLIVLAAICVLISTVWLPVFQITGKSMEPNLTHGQIVLAYKTASPEQGDIVALRYEDQILIRRIIGMPGDWIVIDSHGNVRINDMPIEEYYLMEKVLKPSDITYPYQVPEGSYFVMGDHRTVSLDSRMSVFGCVEMEKLVGKIVFRIWPLREMRYMG